MILFLVILTFIFSLYVIIMIDRHPLICYYLSIITLLLIMIITVSLLSKL